MSTEYACDECIVTRFINHGGRPLSKIWRAIPFTTGECPLCKKNGTLSRYPHHERPHSSAIGNLPSAIEQVASTDREYQETLLP